MVDSISSSGPFQNAQALTPPSKPTGAPPSGAPQGPPPGHAAPSDGAPSQLSAAQGVDLSGSINGDLSKDEALTQSQAAGQQLSSTGLSIANRAPQALYSALSG